jgi:hypothetical protein
MMPLSKAQLATHVMMREVTHGMMKMGVKIKTAASCAPIEVVISIIQPSLNSWLCDSLE